MKRPRLRIVLSLVLIQASAYSLTARADDRAVPLERVRTVAATTEATLGNIKLPSLPLSYTHGKTIERMIQQCKSSIREIRTAATKLELQSSAEQTYLLSENLTSLRYGLDELASSVRHADVTTDQQNRTVLAISTSLTEAESEVIDVSSEVFLAALDFYRAADERLKNCGPSR